MKNEEERTDSLHHKAWENFTNQVQNKEPSGKLPSNGRIIQPPTKPLIDKNTAPDVLDTFQEKVGSTATQQLPRGIDCSPSSRVPDEANLDAAWQVPLKLTGGSSGCEDNTLPQEPAG
jgi:hypothetical protein